jgi:hypothetical protein
VIEDAITSEEIFSTLMGEQPSCSALHRITARRAISTSEARTG